MPLPNPLSSLLQLPKIMEGTASWLCGCFFASGTVDSSGAAAASHCPEDKNDTEVWGYHCCQEQLEFFLKEKIHILKFSFSFPIFCECLFLEEPTQKSSSWEIWKFNFQCFSLRIWKGRKETKRKMETKRVSHTLSHQIFGIIPILYFFHPWHNDSRLSLNINVT